MQVYCASIPRRGLSLRMHHEKTLGSAQGLGCAKQTAQPNQDVRHQHTSELLVKQQARRETVFKSLEGVALRLLREQGGSAV